MRSKESRQEGMLTVEAVLSLLPFILMILGIISFINILAVHNKIQYALYQMGNELSCYTYLYEALGVRSAEMGLNKDIATETEQLEGTINQVTDFFDELEAFQTKTTDVVQGNIEGIQEAVDQGKKVIDEGKETADSIRKLAADPKALLRGIVYEGIGKGKEQLKTWLLGMISEGFLKVYLDSTVSGAQSATADEYLKQYGVKDGISGLDFSNSKLFEDETCHLIDIVVEYDLEIHFFKLFLKDPTIHVVQRYKFPAWLDGDGIKYSQ